MFDEFKKELRLRLCIRFSNDIPKEYKKELNKRLIAKDRTMSDYHKGITLIKNLYFLGMFYRAYDLFTSSIFAYIENNEISFYTLIRSQLENLFYTNYFCEYPDEIKHVFDESYYKIKKNRRIFKYRKTMTGKDEDWKKFYQFTSDRVHPLVEGLKTPYGNIHLVNFRDKKIDPGLVLRSHHNRGLSEKDKENEMKTLIALYDQVVLRLAKIRTLCPDIEIRDYGYMHRKTYDEY